MENQGWQKNHRADHLYSRVAKVSQSAGFCHPRNWAEVYRPRPFLCNGSPTAKSRAKLFMEKSPIRVWRMAEFRFEHDSVIGLGKRGLAAVKSPVSNGWLIMVGHNLHPRPINGVQ
jgi:hypothetical protein